MSILDRLRGPIWLLCVVLVVGTYVGWTYLEAEARAVGVDAERRRRVVSRVEIAQAIQQARDRDDRGRIERLRLELRGAVRWSADHLAREGVLWLDDEEVENRPSSDARRLHGLLGNALREWPGASAIELLVAGEQGIWTHRIERVAPGESAEDASPREVSLRIARTPQTLWYAPAVQRALSASGRRSHSEEIRWERAPSPDGGAESERPISRLAMALHGPNEITQGALVVSLDAAAWAASVSSLSDAEEGEEIGGAVGVALVAPDGRLLGERNDRLATRFADSTHWIPSFVEAGKAGSKGVAEIGTAYVFGRPLSHDRADPTSVWIIGKVSSPDRGWLAWTRSGAATGVWALLAMAGLQGLTRRVRVDPNVVRYEVLAEDAEAAPGDDRGGLPVATTISAKEESAPPLPDPNRDSGPMPVRDWLGDLRGCLEREAARRGGQVNLGCARSIETEVLDDSVRLGGLVLAIGRQALEASPESHLRLAFRKQGDGRMRVDFEGSGATRQISRRLGAVAAELGARFLDPGPGAEPGSERVALEFPIDRDASAAAA